MRKYLIRTPGAILPDAEGGKCPYAHYFSHVVLRIRECGVFSTISSPQYYLIVPSHPGHHSKCLKMRQLVLIFDLFIFVKYMSVNQLDMDGDDSSVCLLKYGADKDEWNRIEDMTCEC